MINSATKQSSPDSRLWIASRSLSSGAHSRDPLARNDGYAAKNAKKPITAVDNVMTPL
jgi:hypothetical protein